MTLPSPQSPYINNSLSPPSSPLSPTPSTMNSHFVQALHDYLPSSVCTDESVSCLFFKKGSIIEVFNRDDSGWWDGQCGEVRGWFPSNYVGRIGELKRQSADFEDDSSNDELEMWHQRMKTHNNNTSTVSLEDHSTKISSAIQSRVEMAKALLREDRRKSGTTFYSTTITNELHALIGDVTNRVADLVEACNDPTQSNIQLHVCQVVSLVRSVLIEANIVNKESTLLRIYPELARQRKVVLSALSRLVLKSKDLQQSNPVINIEEEEDQVSFSADHLLNEMDMFERLLLMIPRQSTSDSTESTVESTRHSSLFQFDTPRSSVSSLGHSSIMSTSSTNLRQFMTETRHSNNSSASLIFKAVPISDKEHILQNILDHQASIDELMGGLVVTLERYLANRHRATEMLETTRKAVEAVRTFLAVVEHVCSNLGDLDYNRRLSMIPEDPCLVSLVITKESVYSAITNLVTAVRALTGPQQNETLDSEHDVAKDDLDHLNVCCEDVVRTTNECAACVRACLETEAEDEEKSQAIQMRNMQESNKPEFLAETSIRRSDTLSMLGRKVTTLYAIQQYREDQQKETVSLDKAEQVESHSEQDIEGLAVHVAPKHTTTEMNATKNEPMEESMQVHADLRASVQSPTPSSPSSTLGAETLNNDNTDSQPTEVNRPIETILSRRLLSRSRASSVNNAQFFQMPPLPPKSNLHLKPSVSAAFPLPPNNSTPVTRDILKSTPKEVQTLKSRRSRGLSVTSLRPSLSKSKSERINNSLSTESFVEPMRLQKLPSWMSLGHASDKSDNASRSSIENIMPTSSMSLQIPKKEPEFEYMKQYIFTEEEMIFNNEGEVTGATVEALIRNLTLHEKQADLIFTRAFFYNFRLFTNPADFVKLLTDRFALEPPTVPAPLTDDQLVMWTKRVLTPIRLRVSNVIKMWLETYFSYEQDAYVLPALLKFASTEMVKVLPDPISKRMIDLIKKTFASKGSGCAGRKHNFIKAQKSTSSRLQSSTEGHGSHIFSNFALFDDHHSHFESSSEKYPPSILGKSIKNTLRKALSQTSLAGIHVNDIDPVELARQLTLMENNLFCRIRPNEMIGQEFKKKVGTSQAIHVKAMIQCSTQITSWVSDTILHETDTKKRAHVLKYWIKVADACLQLNNYNTPMAIRSALDSTSIARLRKTWDYVSGKYRAIWEPIYRATDSQRNFAEYRQRLKTTVAPCLPFLGVYLTDMTFIDDGNADHRLSPGGKPLVNFDKYLKTTRILNEIDQFQIPYKLLEVGEIQKYIKTTLEAVEQDDQVFYSMSLKREPKEEDPTDK